MSSGNVRKLHFLLELWRMRVRNASYSRGQGRKGTSSRHQPLWRPEGLLRASAVLQHLRHPGRNYRFRKTFPGLTLMIILSDKHSLPPQTLLRLLWAFSWLGPSLGPLRQTLGSESLKAPGCVLRMTPGSLEVLAEEISRLPKEFTEDIRNCSSTPLKTGPVSQHLYKDGSQNSPVITLGGLHSPLTPITWKSSTLPIGLPSPALLKGQWPLCNRGWILFMLDPFSYCNDSTALYLFNHCLSVFIFHKGKERNESWVVAS